MFWRKETGQTPSYQGAKPTIEISNPEFQLSVRYLKLTPEQLEVLQEIKPIIERYAEQAVSEFYSHLQTIPEMKKFIQENTTVDRLGQTMKQYLLSLTPMRIDDSYIENRKMVGQVHNRINLPPYWYTSAYQFHYNFFIPKIIDAFAGQPERAKKAVQAFLTITNLDQQLGMSSYIQHYTAGLSKKDELEQILGNLQSLQNRVNDASQSLAATAEETAAAAAHMSSASDRIAENVTQAKEHTSEVVDQAKKGEAELRKAVEAFKELAEMLSLMRNKITTLDESSEKIDSIANVIRGIASQTNLLALNAAIESARAGEHGRGFSVVAQEVKKLAGSSEQSVQEITDMIGQSRVHTSEVSQAMAETLKSMEYMEEMVDKVVQAFTFILSSVASNEEQMAFVSQEVQNLSATAKEIEGASESVAHAAEDLSLMAH